MTMTERIQQEREARVRLKREKEEVSDVVPHRFWVERLITCCLSAKRKSEKR